MRVRPMPGDRGYRRGQELADLDGVLHEQV